jgi:Flp pilus assembly protein protease CpaA
VVLFAGLLGAAVTDFRTGKIPNVLTFPMMALGIAIHLTTGADPWLGLVGCAAAFALHFAIFALQIEKAGDAKLMMGVGACVGWREMIEATMWLAIIYLPIGLVMLAVQGKLPNLVKSARYVFARMQGRPAGDPPEATYVRAGPILLVAAAIGWATDWLARLL